MGLRSWFLGLFAPTRRTGRRNMSPRAERRLAAKERHRQDRGPLWTEADRHVIRTRQVPVGRSTSLVEYVTVVDEEDEARPEDDNAASVPGPTRGQ
jgi:hypothetical protein